MNVITTSCYVVLPPGFHTTDKLAPQRLSSECTGTPFARESRRQRACYSVTWMTQILAQNSGPRFASCSRVLSPAQGALSAAAASRLLAEAPRTGPILVA